MGPIGNYLGVALLALTALAQPILAQSTGEAPRVTVAGPAALSQVLFAATFETFARDSGYKITREIRDDSQFTLVVTDGDTGSIFAEIDVGVQNTENALAALNARSVDLALATRALAADERAAFDIPPVVQVLGRDAIVAITSRDNSVSSIDRASLVRVLEGELRDWSEIGGLEAPITLHLPSENGALDPLIRSILLADSVVSLDVVRHPNLQSLSDAVASDDLALGVTSFSSVGNARPLGILGSCGFEIGADRRAIKNHDYPLTLPLLAVALPESLPPIFGEYFAFLDRIAAQGAIRHAGFVDQLTEETALVDQGNRLTNAISLVGIQIPGSELRRLVNELEDLNRLSVTFRFEPGSAREMDDISKSQIVRLARALEDGVFEDRALTIVGFSDGVGSSSQNLRVSRSRAAVVEEALLREAPNFSDGGASLSTAAFGESLPLACDDSEWGRFANRRVEIWID